ncbi:MAG: DUF4860 domain-containing protein [Clostridia bacterium]|nr:DUF4860 domain-containing protein [Clostridia bacterium]MBR0356348.1 DUF4860 domain-containing protein [Clostridia bacterium]
MVLLLFGVFAVCILVVLLSGTSVYDRLTRRDEAVFDSRSAVQYLATRVHQAENADAVSLRIGEDGGAVLCIRQTYGDEMYETLLYCREGWLFELFEESGADVDTFAGEKILPVESLAGSYDNGLLTLSIKDENGEQQVVLLLRGGEVLP